MENSVEGLLRWPDLVVIAVNLVLVVGIGVYCARRQTSSDSFFLGNRAMPGWVVGISMMATIISSISFLSLPATTFAKDWRFMPPHVLYFVPAIVALFVFMPFFRRGRVRSAYEYLELRFGVWARVYGAAIFVIHMIFRMGLILYTISLPIQQMSGMPLPYVILTVGILIAAYAIAGGLEAVIYTDVLQGLALIFGVLICVSVAVGLLPGGFSQIVVEAHADGKFSVGSMALDFSEQTFWVVLIVYQWGFLQYYATDQGMVQRYLAMKSDKEAGRGLLLGAFLPIPVWLSVAFVGTALYVLYKTFPSAAVEGMEPEGVLTYFVLTEIPAGVAGLIIAALLAACMSSIDSAINAAAATATNDFYRRLAARDRDEAHYLKAGRWFSVLFSVIGIGAALIIHFSRTETLLELMLVVGGVTSGGLGGIFLLGFFTSRIGSRATIVATVSTLVPLVVWGFFITPFGKANFPAVNEHLPNDLWIAIIPNFFLIAVAFLVRPLFPRRSTRDLQDLTIWTKSKGNHS